MSTLNNLERQLSEARREENRHLKARHFDRVAYRAALAKRANAELALETFRRLGEADAGYREVSKPRLNCPMAQSALDNPPAFTTGYYAGWRSGMGYWQATGGNLAPTPFFQASPAWIYGQLLREELTPFAYEHTPYAFDRF